MKRTHAGAKIYEVVPPNIMTTDPKQQNLSILASLEVLESDLHHQFALATVFVVQIQLFQNNILDIPYKEIT